MLKVGKKCEFDLSSWVDISHITRPRASKFCMTLWVTFSNIFPKSGVWNKNGVEMLKVEKKCEFYLSSWVDISHITRPRASKFCMTPWVTLSNIFPKYGVWDKNGVEILKVRKNVNLTLVHGSISHTLRDLGHPNFVWYFDLHLVRFSQSLVYQIRMMQKCSDVWIFWFLKKFKT